MAKTNPSPGPGPDARDEMSGPRPRAILVLDGGVGSLAVLAMQRTPESVLLWDASMPGDAGRQNAVLAAARRAGLLTHLAAAGPVGEHASGSPSNAPTLPESDGGRILLVASLLRIAAFAIEIRCPRILWPIHCGGESSAVMRIAELIEAAEDVIGPRHAGMLEAPIADLSDEQIVDLIEEAGAPIDGMWPCRGTDHATDQPADGVRRAPCGTCPSCRRWRTAWRATGFRWPWPVGDVTSPGQPEIEVTRSLRSGISGPAD